MLPGACDQQAIRKGCGSLSSTEYLENSKNPIRWPKRWGGMSSLQYQSPFFDRRSQGGGQGGVLPGDPVGPGISATKVSYLPFGWRAIVSWRVKVRRKG